jgi:hypothetical protein
LYNLSRFEGCDILDEGRIFSDVWLSNIGESPERIDWKDKTLMPFKNPKQFASDDVSIQAQLEGMSLVWGVRQIRKFEAGASGSELALLVKAQATKLLALGISPDDLGILVLYQYEAQCSMEFSVHQLKRLSDAGLALSISCWQG